MTPIYLRIDGKYWRFAPVPDITAYELALILQPVIVATRGGSIDGLKSDDLGTAMRHFIEETPPAA